MEHRASHLGYGSSFLKDDNNYDEENDDDDDDDRDIKNINIFLFRHCG
jgi:hypothetical protein